MAAPNSAEAKWTALSTGSDIEAISSIDRELRESALRVASGPRFVLGPTAARCGVAPSITARSRSDIGRVIAIDHQ